MLFADTEKFGALFPQGAHPFYTKYDLNQYFSTYCQWNEETKHVLNGYGKNPKLMHSPW